MPKYNSYSNRPMVKAHGAKELLSGAAGWAGHPQGGLTTW